MTTSTSSRKQTEIRRAFEAVGCPNLPPSLLRKCAALSTTLSTSPAALAESWEVHSLNKNVDVLNDSTFGPFRQALLAADGGGGGSTEGRAVVSRRVGREVESPGMVTPSPKKARRGAAASSSSASPLPPGSGSGGAFTDAGTTAGGIRLHPTTGPKYAERTGAGKTVVTYTGSAVSSSPQSSTRRTGGGRAIVDYASFSETNVQQEPRRVGFTPLEVRARALDDHLVRLGGDIVTRYDLDQEEEQGQEDGGGNATIGIAPVGVPRQEAVRCIGRICNEAHEGKINRTSIVLEGSRHHSNGIRVPLSLDSVPSFSLFSGQIVAVEGINSSGRKFVANKIYDGAPPPKVQTTAGELVRYQHDPTHGLESRPLSVVMAAGPFSTSDNLDYEPLSDLLNTVLVEDDGGPPDVVILTGPFVDVRHPLVASGRVELPLENGEMLPVTYEVLFAQKVAALLEGLYQARADDSHIHTQFVLLPSLDDAVAQNVFPQPPLMDLVKGGMTVDLEDAHDLDIELGTLGLQHAENIGRVEAPNESNRRIHFLPNPCTFRINEVVFGATSTDVLHHICSDETSANLPEGRMARVSQHLLHQQSYYPLFPPPAGPNMTANLDLKRMDKWRMPCTPDILLVPSKLATFAKRVSDCVVINPGLISKGTTGGTYARVEVHPMKRETLEDVDEGVEMDHGVQDRVKVEIKRV